MFPFLLLRGLRLDVRLVFLCYNMPNQYTTASLMPSKYLNCNGEVITGNKKISHLSLFFQANVRIILLNISQPIPSTFLPNRYCTNNPTISKTHSLTHGKRFQRGTNKQTSSNVKYVPSFSCVKCEAKKY
jgi:hypothetical protein